MKLVELKAGFQMSVGAPEPLIVSSDSELLIAFYAYKDSNTFDHEHNELESIEHDEIYALKFKTYIKFSSGMPGNETLQGHPYSRIGMESHSFYELKDSDWVKQLENISKVHPYYDADRWKNYKHFILTFHDSMFECIAKEFIIIENFDRNYNIVANMLNEL